ncbi:MAG: dihydroorotase [Thermovirgaceae bacterium]|nr:dihydroorotase [Thermovirgaceae bacterium]
MKILFRNGLLFDGRTLSGGKTDVLTEDGVISRIGACLDDNGANEIYDLSDLIISPGFIDLHCHLRDPGQEWREDLLSGSRAGAAGGFSTLVCMPNTDPPVDNAALIRYLLEKGEECDGSRVVPAGCLSRERAGKNLAEMGKMAIAGAVLFTDDGSPVSNTNLLRLALQYSSRLGVRIMEHPEDRSLTLGAQVNDGICSTISGLKGWPSSAEASDIFRGASLSMDTGVPIHFTHVSTKESMNAMRVSKASGCTVTCDVTPHHLCLDENMVISGGYDGVFKVNPPLRSVQDVDALWEGVRDGTVDAIATDHAPYHMDEKDLPFQESAFGIASLECAVAAILHEWKRRKDPCPLGKLLSLFTSGPASLLPEKWRTLGVIAEGSPADLTVINPDFERVVDVSKWESKARSTPWNGRTLKGWPVMTVVRGKVAYKMPDHLPRVK